MASRSRLNRKRIEAALDWRLRRRQRQRLSKRRQSVLNELAELDAEEADLHRRDVLDLVRRFGAVDPEFWCALTRHELLTTDEAVDRWFAGPTPRAPISLLGIPGKELPGIPVQKENPSSEPTQHQEPLIRYVAGVDDDPDFPFFDCDSYRSDVAGSQIPVGQELAHFVRNAAPDTPLPASKYWAGPPPTWGAWRAAMLRVAQQSAVKTGGSELLSLRKEWDHELDSQLVQQCAATALPSEHSGPLVSIIMPARNRGNIIRRAIDSVQRQTLDDWELLVIDDGSSDDTASVVSTIAEQDPRVQLIKQEWAGAAVARNVGIAAARGEFVAFLDTDDEWTQHFLQVAAATLVRDRLDCVYLAVELTRDNETFYRAFDGELSDLLAQNFITMSALVLRRTLLSKTGGMDPDLRRWIDYDFVIRVFQHCQPRMVPVVGLLHDDTYRPDRITTSEPDYWEYVVRAKYLLDWDAQKSQLSARVPGRVSIVIPTFFDWKRTAQAVQSVMENSGGFDVEIIIVENSGNLQYRLILQGLYALHERIHVVEAPSPLGFALGSNYGFTHSSGEFAVFLNNDTRVEPGWLDQLVPALTGPEVGAAQPLLLNPDGTIQAAGAVVPECKGLPLSFLADHPSEDATMLGSRRFRMGTSAALMVRASDFVELTGFDERYINGWEGFDLCLRLEEHRGEGVVVEPQSRVVHYESKSPGWSRYSTLNRQTFAATWLDRLERGDAAQHYFEAGFEVVRYTPGPVEGAGANRTPVPVLRRRDKQVQTRLGEIPSLRWAIKVAAHAGPEGDHWGDVYFADDLAASLRNLGQEVVIDRRDAHDRRTADLDNVVLVIRGLDSYSPQPGATNILWVISHPDDVSAAEINSYDLAFAASTQWAETMSSLCRIPVAPLLQATNTERFSPETTGTASHEILFVGSSRDQVRPIIAAAVQEDLPLAVYGPDWEGKIPSSAIVDRLAAPEAVPGLYAKAQVVLCDHWPDMAAQGFISNRIFDAVAAGTSVVTDPVADIDVVFGEAVRQWSPAESLSDAVSQARLSQPPASTVERVRRDHSFDRRAESLLEAVLGVRPN